MSPALLARAPALVAESLYRIGPMTPHGEATHSLEGHLLPVSACPNAWMHIARIGADEINEITAQEGVRLLDMHACLDDHALKAAVTEWACDSGLAVQSVAYRAWYFDCEDEDWRYMELNSQEEAEREAAGQDSDSGPDGGPPIEPVLVLKASAAAIEQTGAKAFEHLGEQLAFILLAQTTRPDLHGVYWDERYDPVSLSAPRAGLYPDRLGALTSNRITEWPDDEQALDAIRRAAPQPTVTRSVVAQNTLPGVG